MKIIILLALLAIGVLAAPAQAHHVTVTVQSCKDSVSGADSNDNERSMTRTAISKSGRVHTGQAVDYLGYVRFSRDSLYVTYRWYTYQGAVTVDFNCDGDLVGYHSVVNSCEDGFFAGPGYVANYVELRDNDHLC